MRHEGRPLDVQPLLRWAGSKKRSRQSLLDHKPQRFGKYIEPFAGSAALFFSLQPDEAILSDVNPHVVHFYKCARNNPEEVFEKFSELPRNKRKYYEIRTLYQTERRSIQRAAYFFYLNRNCFNGIFRVNKNGKFNVPFAADRVPPYPCYEEFRSSLRALNTAKLIRADFEVVCDEHVAPDDFVYLDPPYYLPKTRIFQEYVPHEFANDDLQRLKDLLKMVDRRRAKFLLSYPDGRLTQELANNWNRRKTKVHRSIAGDASKRGYSSEILIFNYEID